MNKKTYRRKIKQKRMKKTPTKIKFLNKEKTNYKQKKIYCRNNYQNKMINRTQMKFPIRKKIKRIRNCKMKTKKKKKLNMTLFVYN